MLIFKLNEFIWNKVNAIGWLSRNTDKPVGLDYDGK